MATIHRDVGRNASFERKIIVIGANKIKKWVCEDCSIGEVVPCEWYVYQTGSSGESYPVSCPYGTCGEDAEWKRAANTKKISSNGQSNQATDSLQQLKVEISALIPMVEACSGYARNGSAIRDVVANMRKLSS